MTTMISAGLRPRFLLLLLLPLLLFAAACTADDPPAAPSSTAQTGAIAAPAATSTAVATGTGAVLEPNGDRIKGIVSRLAVNIGSRPAGCTREEVGANLIAGLLRGAG
jgi:hypothetical protein